MLFSTKWKIFGSDAVNIIAIIIALSSSFQFTVSFNEYLHSKKAYHEILNMAFEYMTLKNVSESNRNIVSRSINALEKIIEPCPH